jgi:hypothetical protein
MGYDIFVSNIITGFSIGIGSALANYFVTKHLITLIENKKGIGN